MGDKNKIRIPWHPAFYGGIELELRFQRLQAELAESQAQIMRERKESQVQIAKLQAEIERLKRGGLK